MRYHSVRECPVCGSLLEHDQFAKKPSSVLGGQQQPGCALDACFHGGHVVWVRIVLRVVGQGGRLLHTSLSHLNSTGNALPAKLSKVPCLHLCGIDNCGMGVVSERLLTNGGCALHFERVVADQSFLVSWCALPNRDTLTKRRTVLGLCAFLLQTPILSFG